LREIKVRIASRTESSTASGSASSRWASSALPATQASTSYGASLAGSPWRPIRNPNHTPIQSATTKGAVALGVDVHAVSARTGEGLEQLIEHLAPGRTVVLIGPSGVGKSSLVIAFRGEETVYTLSARLAPESDADRPAAANPIRWVSSAAGNSPAEGSRFAIEARRHTAQVNEMLASCQVPSRARNRSASATESSLLRRHLISQTRRAHRLTAVDPG